jgi:O-acetyl-ADP-ribose deacetylase (regulator of RNase III)
MTAIRALQGDITTQQVDAVVNAANSALAGGGGVDGAIHRAAGPVISTQGRAWVTAHGPLATGQAMITDAGGMAARYVIHTVGPIWGEQPAEMSSRLLADCYRNSLDLAAAHDCAVVAFPSISTGAFGYPKREAAEVAVTAVTEWTEQNPVLEKVVFVCFQLENLSIYEELLRG